MTQETTDNDFIISPLVRSDIASRRASQFIRHLDSQDISGLILYKNFVNKKIKSIKQKFLDILQKKYPGIHSYKFYDKKTCIGIFYFFVDYEAERITPDKSFKDTSIAYTGTFIRTDDYYTKHVLFTFHSIKRLIERSEKIRNLTNDDTRDILTKIGNDVDEHYHNVISNLSKDDDPQDSYKVQYDTFEVIYKITKVASGRFAPTVLTVINKEDN